MKFKVNDKVIWHNPYGHEEATVIDIVDYKYRIDCYGELVEEYELEEIR
jgi:hypothetical protein